MSSKLTLFSLTFVLLISLLRSEDTDSTGDDKCDHNDATNESCAKPQDDHTPPKTINKKKALLIYKELNATLERIRK